MVIQNITKQPLVWVYVEGRDLIYSKWGQVSSCQWKLCDCGEGLLPCVQHTRRGWRTSTRHLVYVTLCRWLVCRYGSIPAYQTVTYIEWHIPDVVVIQLIPLMMSTWLFETCRISK